LPGEHHRTEVRRLAQDSPDRTTYMRDGVVSSESEGRLEETKNPRYSVVPASLVDVRGENEVAGLVVARGAGEAGDSNDSSSSKRPMGYDGGLISRWIDFAEECGVASTSQSVKGHRSSAMRSSITHQLMADLLRKGRMRIP